MATAADEPTVEETLAWEAEQRPRAGGAAIAAGLFTGIGTIIGSILASNQPRVLLVDGLRDAAGLPLPGRKGLLTAQLQYYSDHLGTLVLEGIISALGMALVAVVLGYLFRATQARNPQMPRVAIYLALLGPILLGVAILAQRVALGIKAHDFAGGSDFSTQAGHDAANGGVVAAMQILQAPAVLATAAALLLVSLNAMRVGLLTRFMGILGIITGVLLVFPLGGSPVVVQSFWLIALGLLILGRWPNAMPHAWLSGRAEPWPSQQQMREAREAAAGRGAPAPATAPEAPAEPIEPTAGAADQAERRPHPSSKKKRKRR